MTDLADLLGIPRDGIDGVDGPPGPRGPKGDRGPQGEKGDKGPQGPKGDRGPQGRAGADGQDGIDGFDGKKGDRGPRGPEGERGPEGKRGPKGDKGDKGEKGDRGPSGHGGGQGPQGIPGPTGPQGPPGGGGGSGLPPQWTTDDVTGEVVGAAEPGYTPLVLQADVSPVDNTTTIPALTLKAGVDVLVGQNVMNVLDDDGVIAAHVDCDGGGGFAYDRLTWSEGGVVVLDAVADSSGGLSLVPLLEVKHGDTPHSAGSGYPVFSVNTGGGYSFVASSQFPGDRALTLNPATGQSVNILDVWDETYVEGSSFDAAGRFKTRAHSAPADSDLAAGELALWFDPTAGAPTIRFKAKDENGDVFTATIPMTAA